MNGAKVQLKRTGQLIIKCDTLYIYEYLGRFYNWVVSRKPQEIDQSQSNWKE